MVPKDQLEQILVNGFNQVNQGMRIDPGSETLEPIAETIDYVEDLENSEIKKIANDIVDALKSSFIAVGSDPNLAVAQGSIEQEFKDLINSRPAEIRQTYIDKAKELSQASVSIRGITLGRYGQLIPDIRQRGIATVLQETAPVAINPKLLGFSADKAVPVDELDAAIKNGDVDVSRSQIVIRSGTKLFDTLNGTISYIKEKSCQTPSEIEGGADRVLALNHDKLKSIWGPVSSIDPFTAPEETSEEGTSEFEGGPLKAKKTILFAYYSGFNRLEFCVAQVKCVDETNPEWCGSDEISVGVVSIDGQGETKDSGETYIGGGFEDGKSVEYPWPSLVLASFPVNREGSWPKRYQVILTLAEKDCGGFSDFLRKVYDYVAPWIAQKVKEAVQAGLADKIGPCLAEIVGKIAAWVVDKFIIWIIDAFKDDIFPAKAAACILNSASGLFQHPYDRRAYSREIQAQFYGHGGHYDVLYYWRLVK